MNKENIKDSFFLMYGSSISHINNPWKNLISNNTNIRQYSKGSLIELGQNDIINKFYYIINGKIKLSYVNNNGNERTILYASTGTLMNVPTVLTGDLEDCIVECVMPTKIAIFDAKLLQDPKFVYKYPDLFINLLKSLSLHLVIHARRLRASSADFSIRQVASFICELVDKNSGQLVFTPNLSQQDLAILLGIHRTTVTRALVQLRKANIVSKFTKHEVRVLDLEKLKRFAHRK